MSASRSSMPRALPPQHIIGLAGPAGVGKDTTGKALAKILGENKPCRVDYLAKPLYAMASQLSGVPVEELQRRESKEVPFERSMFCPPKGLEQWSPRKLLQFLGQSMRAAFGGDVWVNRLLDRNRDFLEMGGYVIVTDVRYENEAAICNAVVELAREGFAYAGDHPSAMPLPREQVTFTHTLVRPPQSSAEDIVERLVGLKP